MGHPTQPINSQLATPTSSSEATEPQDAPLQVSGSMAMMLEGQVAIKLLQEYLRIEEASSWRTREEFGPWLDKVKRFFSEG